ncbi:MAG: class F sortase [Anaerolineaceae bacterium]|nr:class F sortase [Anaerolineaceae bacterium]
MKRFVILLALLCLFAVFGAAFAHTNPTAIPNLIYDGTDQFLVEPGTADNSNQHFYFRNPWTGEWGTNRPAGHFPGVYTVEWLLVNGDEVPGSDKSGSKISVTIKEFNPPQVTDGLVYDGTSHYLINPNTGKALGSDAYYYRNLYTGEWTQDMPEATDAGTYTVEYYLGNPANPPSAETTGTKLTAVIKKSSSTVTPEPVKPTDPDYPQPINSKYTGQSFPLIKAGKAESGLIWWYQLISFTNASFAQENVSSANAVIENVPSAAWSTEVPRGTQPGTYVIRCVQLPVGVDPENLKATDITKSVDLTVVISRDGNPGTDPQPVTPVEPRPRPSRDPRDMNIPFYFNRDGEDLFNAAYTLPATGFPTRIHMPLSVKPANVNYEELSMRIQIPTINVDAELTGVPAANGSWMVEWLENKAGLLSGSAMPGEGYSMVAAHNHLNAEEFGPFALLFSLEENDRIFVNTAEDGLQIYSVYANELLEPDDMQKMASIAKSEENSLVLVTCENEMIEGGYMNRRAVFAKPLF